LCCTKEEKENGRFTNNLKDLGTSKYYLKLVSTMNCIRMKKNTRFARRKERIKPP
jgi:hypothetical protein